MLELAKSAIAQNRTPSSEHPHMPDFYGLDPKPFDLEHVHGPLTLRPLAFTDRADWNRLWTAYLEFYQTSLPMAQYDLTFGRFLDASEPMFAWLALHDGRPMGLVHIILHRSGWIDGPSCYLQDLYVDPQRRGTGMGRALIEHVYRVVKQAGGTRVHWLTHSSNAIARQLYDRLATDAGFIQYDKAL